MTPQERIKADADNYVKGLSVQHSKAHQHAGYIVGATDVHERAQVLVDVLEFVKHCPATYDKKELLKWIDSAIEKAKVALEQWESGKEVGGEKPIAPLPDLGTCKECKNRRAVTDYNGHGHFVCQLCDDSLNREFDEEYR